MNMSVYSLSESKCSVNGGNDDSGSGGDFSDIDNFGETLPLIIFFILKDIFNNNKINHLLWDIIFITFPTCI